VRATVTKKGSTSVISFSCTLETLLFLDEYGETKGGLNRSVVIRHFIRLGRTYDKILDEQLKEIKTRAAVLKEKEEAAAAGAKNAKK